MPSTGVAPARSETLPTPTEIRQPDAPLTSIPPRVRQAAAYPFFLIVAISVLDSLLVILGSHVHLFTQFGVSAVLDKFSGRALLHVMANGWFGAPLVILGFSAAEGRKWAVTVGMTVYAIDALLLLVGQDYFSIPFHGMVLYALYRSYSALNQSPAPQAAPAS